jgi:two-component system sensor kinase FixL
VVSGSGPAKRIPKLKVFWHKDGSAVTVEYTSKPINDEGDAHSGGVVIFRDIADRKAAEIQVKQANEELEEFAYRTSHDLRSPLVSSIALLGMAEKAIHDDNKKMALTSVSHSQNSLKKLEALVKDILVLTQTKNEQEEDQAIVISALIEGAIDKFRYMDNFERLDIQLDLAFSEALLTKRNRVSLIIENLISNAAKYQDLGKATSFLRISTYKSGDQFVMAFEDNGLGIPKDQQHKMFEMFKRFHPRTSFGTGLGLYMMKKSADILGGEIRFEDTGDGTLFKLFIPITSC